MFRVFRVYRGSGFIEFGGYYIMKYRVVLERTPAAGDSSNGPGQGTAAILRFSLLLLL